MAKKKPSRSYLVKKLDTVFSQYIRRRYAKNDIAECVTCGKKDHWKKMDAGHFMSRKHYSTRWHEDNVQVQCKSCNLYNQGEQYKYSIFLGDEKSEELYMMSKQTVKISNYDLEELIELYQQKLAELT
jgi:hypothetical protein